MKRAVQHMYPNQPLKGAKTCLCLHGKPSYSSLCITDVLLLPLRLAPHSPVLSAKVAAVPLRSKCQDRLEKSVTYMDTKGAPALA